MEALSKHFNPSVSHRRAVQVSLAGSKGGRIDRYVCRRATVAVGVLRIRYDAGIPACGVNDRNIQKSLLAQKDLTYAKAVELAVFAEAAVRSMRDLGIKPPVSGGQDPLEVHKTDTQKITCYHCGGQGHTSSKCKVDKNIVCHQRHKRGHMEWVCRSKGKHGGSVKAKCKTQSVGLCARERGGGEQEDEDASFNTVDKVDTPSPPIIIKVKLDDCLVDMEVDTGTSISLMSEWTFNKLWPGRTLQPSTLTLRTYLRDHSCGGFREAYIMPAQF